jgi:formylglycine-generating enzyme required for sulfatase activity
MQWEYSEVIVKNPSKFKGWDLPVENISWYDAIEYCNRRSKGEGLIPAYTVNKERHDPNNHNNVDHKWLITWNRNTDGYRLPTEAEWEYACRAGTVTPFNTGNDISTKLANYYEEKTVDVGSFPPNLWGIYDMHGNVYEWCWDWYGEYSKRMQTSPIGPSYGKNRVLRGGSWYNKKQCLRSAYRYNSTASYRSSFVGFRLVRNVK